MVDEGDIRSGSTKRSLRSAGEGAAVVPLFHSRLAELARLGARANGSAHS